MEWSPAEIALLAVILWVSSAVCAQETSSHRPPAVPLIVNDPYFSVWSMADKLTDVQTQHWSEAAQPMTGLIRIDGKVFRWMGVQPHHRADSELIEPMRQDSVEVAPLHTTYIFARAGVELRRPHLALGQGNSSELSPPEHRRGRRAQT
jgi:hypothetical protein